MLLGMQLRKTFISICPQPIEAPVVVNRESHTLLKVSLPSITAMANPGVCHRSRFWLTSLSKLAVNGEAVGSFRGTC